jgi:hypothetical protein
MTFISSVIPVFRLVAVKSPRILDDLIPTKFILLFASSRPSSPGAGISTLDPIGGSANSDGPQEDGAAALS